MMQVTDSERLTFRLMTEHDAELLHELDQDAEVMRYINGGKAHNLETIKTESIPRLQAFTTPDKGWGYWQITDKHTKEFIGWVLVRPVGFFDQQMQESNIEIGWRLKQKFWGKGLASEAATAITNELKQQPSVKKLSAFAIAENHGSINIMKKLGMIFVKQELESTPYGTQEQIVTYELPTS